VRKNYLPPEPGHVSTTAHELLVERDAACQELATLKAAVQRYLAAERAYVQAWEPTTVYTQQFRAARDALAALVGAE
jgi:hypothetical protein